MQIFFVVIFSSSMLRKLIFSHSFFEIKRLLHCMPLLNLYSVPACKRKTFFRAIVKIFALFFLSLACSLVFFSIYWKLICRLKRVFKFNYCLVLLVTTSLLFIVKSPQIDYSWENYIFSILSNSDGIIIWNWHDFLIAIFFT